MLPDLVFPCCRWVCLDLPSGYRERITQGCFFQSTQQVHGFPSLFCWWCTFRILFFVSFHMPCQIQLQVVLHFHNPVPVKLDSSLTFLLCHLSMLSPLVELLFMSELRRLLLIYTGHLQSLLVKLYLLTLQVVILQYQLALLDCSFLHGVFPWILSSKQLSEEIWSLLSLKSMLVLMLLVLLLIVRRNPKLLHTKNIYIHPLPFVDFFFFFPWTALYRKSTEVHVLIPGVHFYR